MLCLLLDPNNYRLRNKMKNELKLNVSLGYKNEKRVEIKFIARLYLHL